MRFDHTVSIIFRWVYLDEFNFVHLYLINITIQNLGAFLFFYQILLNPREKILREF